MLRHIARTPLILPALLIALGCAGAASAQTRIARPAAGADATDARQASTPLSGQRRCDRVSVAARECVRLDRLGIPSEGVTAQNGARRRDPLWNGALIGAALGTMAGIAGSFAISDCSECAGFNVPLTFGILGGGIGAGLGAGIDALRDRRPGYSGKARRIRMSPLLAKGRRGVVAVIRF